MRKLLLLASVVCLLAACDRKKEKPQLPAPAPDVDPALAALFQPLPASFESKERPLTDAKVELGRLLFFEARLSKNYDVSCNTCHALDKFGVDGLPTSRGHRRQTGTRNAPTVYNAAGHIAQFWDGRATDVEEQAKGPILNPLEMASANDAAVVGVLRSIPGYVDAFARAFPGDPDPVTYAHVGDAIGAFERKLVTPSRFDRYLAGEAAALTREEERGLKLFVEAGCAACHGGATVGGRMYQKLGLVKPYADSTDQGRYGLTKAESDRMVFKVPSLRNVEKTAPYFHRGTIADLPTAVRTMADLQLGRTLSPEQTFELVAMLHSMTGQLPRDLIAPPKLPPSGPTTPLPDPT